MDSAPDDGWELVPVWVTSEVECAVCGHTHQSVHAVFTPRLECPGCGYMTVNPDYEEPGR